jgi:microcystin-dependent protein
MPDLNNIQRPGLPYVPETVLPNSNRYDLLQQTGQPVTARQIDGESNYFTDVFRSMWAAIQGLVVGILPGANQLANANKFPTTNGQDPAVISWTLVQTQHLTDSCVTEPKIADSSVTHAKLGPACVQANNVYPRAITNQAIDDNAVDTHNILDGSVTNPKLSANSVTTANVIDSAITTLKIVDQAVTAQKIANNTITNQQLVPAVQTPIGALIDYAGGNGGYIPPGWLNCIGQAVDRVAYAALFGVIGITYGAGDGATTFNLPDFRGRTSFGVDMNYSGQSQATNGRITTTTADLLTNGGVGGEETHQLTVPEMPSHNHSYTKPILDTTNVGPVTGSQYDAITTTNTGNAGGDQPHNNMPPFMLITKIIYAGV